MITMNTQHVMIPLKIGNRLRNLRRFKHYSISQVEAHTHLSHHDISMIESGRFAYNTKNLSMALTEAKAVKAPISLLKSIFAQYHNHDSYNSQQLYVSMQLIQREIKVLKQSHALRDTLVNKATERYPTTRRIRLLRIMISRIIQYHLQQYHLIRRLLYIKKKMPKSYQILLQASKLSPKLLISVLQVLLQLKN